MKKDAKGKMWSSWSYDTSGFFSPKYAKLTERGRYIS